MSNEYYQAGSTPAPNSPGASATMRAQFALIAAAFDKLPTMAGSEGEFVLVNPSGTGLIASGYVFADFVNISGEQTLSNKTLAWADNVWPGFGSAATKDAGTGAGDVLLLAEADKLPALDATLLTADTATVGDSSERLATTEFVALTVADVGGAVPSNATPKMNGVPAPGTAVLVSRDDHIHPVDTSRAPTSASTAAGTSFVAGGGIASTNVQDAIAELDSEKAPTSASTAAGTSFAPTGGVASTNVQAAIAELDSEKAPTSASTAAGTSFVAGGGIASTNVQAAILELDSEKEPADSTILKEADIGVFVQPYDAATAKTDEPQNFTLPQRSALLTDNDGVFDLSAKQNFKCTTAGSVTLTFSNQVDGLSGSVVFINSSNHLVAAHANTKLTSVDLAKLSGTGTYRIDYLTDGTDTYCSVVGAY